jgi:hypothetical protein
MAVFYTNKATGDRIDRDNDQTYEEILDLLTSLTVPESTLITVLPSGMGLDFHVEDDGTLWVEFYAKEISSAFVTMSVAQQILKRAFDGQTTEIKERYADLIPKWEY